MAGAIQLGDIINFGRLAWEVYQFGWQEEFNATKQYSEFGRDVRGLAENLDILTRVVSQANQSLRDQGAYTTVLRWDPSSLRQIIGDYEDTLRECFSLIESNKRYRLSSGPLRNVEWNVLVQPSAERLRARLALHNSKILHVLKPFEIDLLCRVRQDIYRVHQDLAHRINAVHLDLRRLIGVLVPDLEQALLQQEHRQIHLLEIPSHIAEGFRRTAVSDRPEFGDDNALDLQDMTDAFILHFNQSTIDFTAGMLVENKIPPTDQYLSLLKCVWLMVRIRDCQQLQEHTPESHWPSYVRQLEDDLSAQCDRFNQELVAPIIMSLSPDMLTIWPERELAQLVDVVTKDELMEEVLEVPLNGSASNVQRKLQLFRRMGADGKRFRINISGAEQSATGKTRRQAETIDFDLSSVILNPLYAVPTSMAASLDVILRKDERIAKMAFTQLKDVLKFQQAVTGFKAWDSYIQYGVMASFVVSGRKEPLVERACLQLWIPKPLDGKLVTNTDIATEPTPVTTPMPSVRSPSLVSSVFNPLPVPTSPRDSFFTSPEPFSRSPPDRSPIRSNGNNLPPSARSSTFMSQQPQSQRQSISIPQGQPMAIPRRPVGGQLSSGSPPNRQQSLSFSPSSPRSSNLFPTYQAPPGQSTSPSRSAARNSTISTVTSRVDRTFSISSSVSTAAFSNTSSSGSDAHTVTVSIGAQTTGYLHRRPAKPMLVLFTQNPTDGRLSLVTLQIDEETAVNPERCNCRRSGRDGSSCTIAAIERKKGKSNIEARRFETRDGDVDWNLSRLAMGRREEKGYADALWKDVERVSIMFPESSARAKFGGTPNICQCKAKSEGDLSRCLKSGHRGLFGEVQEFYRKQGNEYHRSRYGTQQQIVNGMRDDNR